MGKKWIIGIIIALVVIVLIYSIFHFFGGPKDLEKKCTSRGGQKFHLPGQEDCPDEYEKLFRISELSLCCKSTIEPIEAEVDWESLEVEKCFVEGSTGGEMRYSLAIVLKDSSKSTFNTITFRIEEENNDPEKLLTIGSHSSTGGAISNSLQGDTYSINLEDDDLEIVFEEINIASYPTEGHSFNGKGYIKINKRIEGFNRYYLPREIPFECVNSFAMF